MHSGAWLPPHPVRPHHTANVTTVPQNGGTLTHSSEGTCPETGVQCESSLAPELPHHPACWVGATAWHLDEALQGPACVADAPLPVLTAGPPGHGFELGGAVPVLSLLDASTPASWNNSRALSSCLLPRSARGLWDLAHSHH